MSRYTSYNYEIHVNQTWVWIDIHKSIVEWLHWLFPIRGLRWWLQPQAAIAACHSNSYHWCFSPKQHESFQPISLGNQLTAGGQPNDVDIPWHPIVLHLVLSTVTVWPPQEASSIKYVMYCFYWCVYVQECSDMFSNHHKPKHAKNNVMKVTYLIPQSYWQNTHYMVVCSRWSSAELILVWFNLWRPPKFGYLLRCATLKPNQVGLPDAETTNVRWSKGPGPVRNGSPMPARGREDASSLGGGYLEAMAIKAGPWWSTRNLSAKGTPWMEYQGSELGVVRRVDLLSTTEVSQGIWWYKWTWNSHIWGSMNIESLVGVDMANSRQYHEIKLQMNMKIQLPQLVS